MTDTTVRLVGVRIHPVKSTAIRRVDRAEVAPTGLVGDREWMVVDAGGEMVSARTVPRLFTITAATPATGDTPHRLSLTAPDADPLHLDDVADEAREARLFRTEPVRVRTAGPEADTWLRRVLRRDDLSLVRRDDAAPRPLTGGRAGDHLALQDASPVTILSTASVAQVEAWAAHDAADRGEEPPPPIHLDRFRPNLVVDGCAAFAEDGWDRVRIGDVTLRRTGLVDRCAMTLLHPTDLTRGKEPVRTLARHRAWDGSTWLAAAYLPETTGTLAVGDPVHVDGPH